MEKKLLFGVIVLALAIFSFCVVGSTITMANQTNPMDPQARAIDPIVSTQWLEDNLDTANLIILDARAPENYAKDEKGVITYGTWKNAYEIREMALAVLGENASQEIIVYCGVGGVYQSRVVCTDPDGRI